MFSIAVNGFVFAIACGNSLDRKSGGRITPKPSFVLCKLHHISIIPSVKVSLSNFAATANIFGYTQSVIDIVRTYKQIHLILF